MSKRELTEKPKVRTEEHLCDIVAKGVMTGEYRALVRNGQFFCKSCGRVAGKAKHLCEPIPLY